ncbi:MAG: sugar-binding domain-containing protein [Bacteroidota bacterium]
MEYRIHCLIWISLIIGNGYCQSIPKPISLAGNWECGLDSLSVGADKVSFNYTVQLPGTLDMASIGKKIDFNPVMEHQTFAGLHRKVNYVGKAWYRKTINIPSELKGKKAFLNLERVIWRSTVYVDGKEIGTQSSLSVPHLYDISNSIESGDYELLICIDNSKQFNTGGSTYKSDWNGLLGDMSILFTDKTLISGVKINADADTKTVKAKVSGQFPTTADYKLKFKIFDKKSWKEVAENEYNIDDKKEYSLKIDSIIKQWDEFNPNLYMLETILLKNEKPVQYFSQDFGFRKIKKQDKVLLINGKKVFLRGTLSVKFLPPTDYTITSKAEWIRLFKIGKSFGLNHYRFHTNCPPKAAFDAADELGIYLQVEVANWSLNFGKDSTVVRFVREEANRIIAQNGNHPSFCLFSLGNELEGDYKLLNQIVSELKANDNRFLYTTSSFSFQKGHGENPEKEDDFFITQKTAKGWVRGQSIFNTEYPRFDKDYENSVSYVKVPFISHEIGQHAAYPDLTEIDKYTGVLSPVNLQAIKLDVDKKGLTNVVADYVDASGKLQVLLYKEEIERALKTNDMSGFQLLALCDWPANTAFIGMLNVFYQPKTYTDSTVFRHFCSELVPLAWFSKAVYTNNQSFEAEVGVTNYFQPLKNQELTCTLKDKNNSILHEKTLTVNEITDGKTAKYGKIQFDLSQIKTAQQLQFSITLEGTKYTNSWTVWVYPEKVTVNEEQVLFTESFEEAEKALNEGKNVLLSPPMNKIKGFAGKFLPVFWSPTHFNDWKQRSEVGTMGLLINPENLAFSYFPTETHSNWQWWDICKNSKTINIESLKVQPLVTVIDNYFKNRRLTNLFEAKVGKGKLIFSSINLKSNLEKRIEARQLRHSLIEYMKSDQFEPKITLEIKNLRQNIEMK